MSSSKVISTSRKRTKRFLTIFSFMLVLLLPLSAGEYRIGLVQDNGIEGVSDFIKDALTFSSSVITDEDLVSANRERITSRLELDRAIERDRARRNEKIYEEKPVKIDESVPVGKVVAVDVDDVTMDFLSRGDRDAVGYLKLSHDLDELVFVSVEEVDGLHEISISIDGSEILFTLYSEMLGGLERKVVPALLAHYRNGRYHLVAIDGNVGAAITENGEDVERFSSYLVLSEGLHDLRFDQVGYNGYSEIVDVDGTLDTVSYELGKKRGDRLFISSNPYPDSLVLNGRKLDSLFAEEADLPFSLTAMKDGYVTRTVQSAKARDSISLQLLPVTFYDKDKLMEGKRSFYGHLLSTLVSFGISVASETLDRMLPDTDLSLVTAGLYGMTATGVVLMVDSLFDYRNALYRSY